MKEKFFMGGNTPSGFFTPLGEFVNSKEYHTFILKGGPGTGKSTLMKKIAGKFESSEKVSVFYCSSDPDSLDAVVLHTSGVVIVDGTAPHVFDPLYPGLFQTIINLGRSWNEESLQERSEEIVSSMEYKKIIMNASASHTRALGVICDDIYSLGSSFLNADMVKEAANDFCEKNFERDSGKEGKKKTRILSVMTRNGYVTQSDTLSNYPKHYLLRDSLFAESDLFIRSVAEKAVEHGYDVKLSPCLILSGTRYEHLLIDDLGIAIVASNPLNHISLEDAGVIDLSAYDEEKMRPLKEHIDNELGLAAHLSSASADILKEAKKIHEKTESFYIEAMDFEALDRIYDDLVHRINGRTPLRNILVR